MALSPRPLTLFTERLRTPIGTLLLVTDDRDRVRVLDWDDYTARMERLLRRHYGADGAAIVARAKPSPASRSLDAYFEGDIRAIDRVPVLTGGTPFQRQVWAALREIPAGQTVSYGEIAATIGRSRAVRAVGRANGANPVGVVVPCHRVIGADASLAGYGGGLARKQWLLAHEGAVIAPQRVRRAAAGSSA